MYETLPFKGAWVGGGLISPDLDKQAGSCVGRGRDGRWERFGCRCQGAENPFFKVPPGHVWVESWGQEEIGPHGPAENPAFYTPRAVKDNNSATSHTDEARCRTAPSLSLSLSQLYFVATIKVSGCNRYGINKLKPPHEWQRAYLTHLTSRNKQSRNHSPKLTSG